MTTVNLDEILVKLGGFGKFQLKYYLYLCCVVIFSVVPLSYIFTARNIKYRCVIEQCNQNPNETEIYKPTWLEEVVPFNEGEPSRCTRYAPDENYTCGNLNHSEIIGCDKFIYERPERTIVHDFNLTCDDNLWKLTIVGTINVFGELVCLPISGIFSDRFGRKTMMLTSLLLTSTIGVIKSFSVSYLMFIVLEFFNTVFGSGNYSGAFILAIELIGPKGRNITNTILSCAFAFGQVLLGLTAWISPDWRIFLRCIYAPGFLLILGFQVAPESVRWLISVGDQRKARTILENIALSNGQEVPHNDLNDLLQSKNQKTDEKTKRKESFIQTIKHTPMLIRTIHCSYTWICCTFVYYGLTIHSVAISDNIYQSFIITVAIEVPAYILTYLIIDRLGRKRLLSISLVAAGTSCIAVTYSQGIPNLALAMFLVGKLCMTTAYTVTYIFTTEIFPTCSRHTLFATCSMFGRLGSMVAPQIPLLAAISKSLPLIMFGTMAFSAGILALFFPETLHTQLPDTIEEAINIGKTNRSDIQSSDDNLLQQMRN